MDCPRHVLGEIINDVLLSGPEIKPKRRAENFWPWADTTHNPPLGQRGASAEGRGSQRLEPVGRGENKTNTPGVFRDYLCQKNAAPARRLIP